MISDEIYDGMEGELDLDKMFPMQYKIVLNTNNDLIAKLVEKSEPGSDEVKLNIDEMNPGIIGQEYVYTLGKKSTNLSLWGYDSESDSHTVDVHIGRLRERFRDNPDFKIVTMRGVGYKVVKL